MDHNLEDALNLDGAIGVDFEHSEDTVVNQADISLDVSSHEESIPMEYDSIEEQSMLMDTGNEEIIVSDFMGDQFTLQEYAAQEEHVSTSNTQQLNENVIVTDSGDILDMQFDQPLSVPASSVIKEEINLQPKMITVKGSSGVGRGAARVAGGGALRHVAIAPRPHKVLQNMLQTVPSKQFAIAPKPVRAVGKPVTLVANRPALGQATRGNTVLTLGKQLVVMGGAGGQKLKLVASGARLQGHDEQAQLIQNVPTSQAQGNKLTKLIVHGSQADANQPAVITKLLALGGALPSSRVVSVHHPRPRAALNKRVILASPTRSGIRYSSANKSQLVALKPSAQAPAAASAHDNTTKKVVITAKPKQNVILKATPKQENITNVSAGSGQKTQLHQINVPGKGIQYIRLVTNPTSSAGKPAPAPAPAARPVVMPPGKTFVLADGKGNLIQVTAEKVMSSQPPPLIVTSSASTTKVSSKPPHKLVRLAPVSSKIGQAAMSRGGQSLLAPLSPIPADPQPTRVADDPELMEEQIPQPTYEQFAHLTPNPSQEQLEQETLIVHDEEPDSKSALRALIADTVGVDDSSEEPHDESEDFARRPSNEYSDSNSNCASAAPEHPLIVVPPHMKQDAAAADDSNSNYDSRRLSGMVNVEVDVGGGPYENYGERPLDDADIVPTELGLRPRKACNCTKSQCLKLYCDCFANGEFCNNCNCNNCHNNLENEELRQKAIRGCLDRNPNAFRPKIGKSRAGGPQHFRRHNKGCNCKRSGCLKNYCECYEAKIACTNICKCVGCRNVEESLERTRRRDPPRAPLLGLPPPRDPAPPPPGKQPCSFMTTEVIEAVCQCLIAAAVESGTEKDESVEERDPIRDVIDEFARCLQDIISASHQATPRALFDETQA